MTMRKGRWKLIGPESLKLPVRLRPVKAAMESGPSASAKSNNSMSISTFKQNPYPVEPVWSLEV